MTDKPKLIKVERAFLELVRDVCEAVVRIDSEEETAPSLADTARGALSVLQRLRGPFSRKVRP